MTLISSYRIDVLLKVILGRPLTDYCPLTVFKDPAEFAAQKPSIHPLGPLNYIGGDCGQDGKNAWVTADGTIIVTANADGVITMIDGAD